MVLPRIFVCWFELKPVYSTFLKWRKLCYTFSLARTLHAPYYHEPGNLRRQRDKNYQR